MDFSFLIPILADLIEDYAEYYIRKKLDDVGNIISEIVAVFDDDGDGVTDREEVLISFDVSIPDLSENYNIVDKDGKVGVGFPQFEIIPATDFSAFLETTITGSNNGILIDDDVYCPLPLDYDGDGLTDWGRVVDDNDNGVPDASPDAPFYPVGSDQYNQIVNSFSSSNGKSIVVVSPDGTVCVYDENGQITADDCDTAYSIWVADNNIMTKPLNYYTPTEGLLFLTFIVSLFGFFGSIFRRRKVM